MKEIMLKYLYSIKSYSHKTAGEGAVVHHHAHCLGIVSPTAWEGVIRGGDSLTTHIRSQILIMPLYTHSQLAQDFTKQRIQRPHD